MREILCVVLGGGRGTRLYPLTKDRSKPAVPFAGQYRLIDIPVSNCLNSGFNNVYVLTQFNSESLNKHIARTYQLDPYTKGFVEIMAADQSAESTDWFQGTADAVRRCLKHFNNPHIKYVLVLSGDQLYKMDFTKLLNFHLEKKSQVTIACNPVPVKQISEFGIMGIDKNGRINNFVEKPEDEARIKKMQVDTDGKKFYLVSMGIYLFEKETLREILTKSKKADFGREVIPESFSNKLTYAYIYDGYWRDIGTIKTFYEENLRFTEKVSPMDLFDEQWQFFTRPRYLASARVIDSKLDRVVLSGASILDKCAVSHSIVGLRSRIREGAQIEDSIIMGADFCEPESVKPAMGIGKNCIIKNAIIDKNARIGDNSKIINQKNLTEFKGDLYSIRDSIVIIPKNTIIPSGSVI
ncbi:MAG: glucose-1-phosphate adenylyltransferase [Candidatus Omnitrophica bacterium]|nr:glucose-1-phosphate adenylyltransferase [Candidatus Omnitrophota bacterium]